MKNQRSKNTELEEVTPNLPFDNIEDVLSRLPVKSLLRFKSVSKPWNFLISNSEFGKLHLQRSIISDDKIMLIHSSIKEKKFTFLKYTSYEDSQQESLEFPLMKYRQAKALCSCDGLILLKNPHERVNMFILWNTAIRKYTTFTCPYRTTLTSSSFGLCYDTSNDDYKVVYINLYYHRSWYAIFSYKRNLWNRVDEAGFGWRSIRGAGQYVSGALHWVKDNIVNEKFVKNSETNDVNDLDFKCGDNRNYEIICFDPRDDEFKKLSKPACFDFGTVIELSVLKGELSVCRFTNNFKMVEIWTMKEYGNCNSWTKLITIENPYVPLKGDMKRFDNFYIKPICLTSKGYYVIEVFLYGLFIYHPKKYISPQNIMFQDLCWNESLLLPKRI